jgi:competence protein ComEA
MLKKLYKKYILNNYKVIIKILCLLLVCSILFLIIYSYSHKKLVNNESKIEAVSEEELMPTSKLEEDRDVIYYYVDIKGAIANPNVYKVEANARIIDVIGLAGGLNNDADTSILNLSKKVTDEMFIIIYTKSEIENFKNQGITTTEVIKYVEKDCECPDPIINDSCINNETEDTSEDSSSTIKIELNSATKEELMTLPGIGESKALAIIEYRKSNGLFEAIEDIKNVTGIGDSIFDKIKDYITL